MLSFLLWMVGLYVLWKILPYLLGTFVGNVINASGLNPLHNTVKLLEDIAIPVIKYYEAYNYIRIKELVSLLFDCFYRSNCDDQYIINVFKEKVLNETDYYSLNQSQKKLIQHRILYGTILLKFAYSKLVVDSYTLNESTMFVLLLDNLSHINDSYKKYVIDTSLS